MECNVPRDIGSTVELLDTDPTPSKLDRSLIMRRMQGRDRSLERKYI